MKRIKILIVPAALLVIAGVAGCHCDGSCRTGLSIIDRWLSPGVAMESGTMQYMEAGTLEYVDEQLDDRPPPAPAPDPPSKLLHPSEAKPNESEPNLILPALPKTSDVSAPGPYGGSEYDRYQSRDDTFFEDESGHTPVPGQ